MLILSLTFKCWHLSSAIHSAKEWQEAKNWSTNSIVSTIVNHVLQKTSIIEFITIALVKGNVLQVFPEVMWLVLHSHIINIVKYYNFLSSAPHLLWVFGLVKLQNAFQACNNTNSKSRWPHVEPWLIMDKTIMPRNSS